MNSISAAHNSTIGLSNDEFKHHHAAHCESGTMTTLLRNQGLEISEPMVFGIGGGIFFLHLPWVKMAGLPVTAYRDAPRSIIKNVCKLLGVKIKSQRFRAPQDGMETLDQLLAEGRPVGLQGNVFWLPYFPEDMRFQYNGHNFVAYGKRGDEYLISDPVSDHVVTCPADALRRARFSKGIFAPKGLIYYPELVPQSPDLESAAEKAIKRSMKRMLDIPVPMFGVRGIRFLARQLENWPQKYGLKKAAINVGNIIRMQEEIGSGGAGFRFIYAAFLAEAAGVLNNQGLKEASERLNLTGDRWREFAVAGALLCRSNEGRAEDYRELAEIMRDCADQEEAIYRSVQKMFKQG